MKMELTIETAATERELQPADALAQYMPLVKATARRYEGRGAEYEDLVQEGCVALLRLTPVCPDHRWLAAWLKNRLPGCVRAAAARLRGQKPNGAAGLEELEEVVSDGEADCEFAEREFAASLEPLLEPQELALVRTLMDGGTQAEAARELGITQQAVAARLRKLRRRLLPLTGESAYAA